MRLKNLCFIQAWADCNANISKNRFEGILSHKSIKPDLLCAFVDVVVVVTVGIVGTGLDAGADYTKKIEKQAKQTFNCKFNKKIRV